MTAIIKKEMRSYFTSMPGYVFLSFFVFITAIFYYAICLSSQVADYSTVLTATSIIFLIVIPMLTMRLFAEERKHGTDQLLFTSPIPVWQIVFGKFISAVLLFVIALLITAIFPALVSPYGELPAAQIIGAFIGYFLLGACFISVGLLISALTDNQIIAAVSTFGAAFLLYIMSSLVYALPKDRVSSGVFLVIAAVILSYMLYDFTKSILAAFAFLFAEILAVAALFLFKQDIFDGLIINVLNWFSLLYRFSNFNKGVLNFADILYYISFCAVFVLCTIGVIEKRRWR